ncbi:MAG: DEAD/DEAH box helicase [Pseudomonadota bacterium]
MTLHANIPPVLAEALAEKGYTALTEVQSAILQPDAAGADLLVSAQTGSGKTVAFGLAMATELLAGADQLSRAGAPMALVIAPTRELALQVQRELSWLYRLAGGRLASCVGGMDARSERRALERGAHIVVGTPGRLRDHITRGALDLSQLKVAVLDEADEMLDFGFREDLEFILDAAPAERRTLLFSATVSRPIAELARQYQRDALRISTLGATGQHADITYLAHTVAGHQRENAVINVLRYHDAPRALVFCATRDAVARLAARLHNRGFRAVALSGELTQAERTKALQSLRDGRANVCVATDVAARGIDLPGLDLVVHAEPPTNAESLLHRSGRTGRAGAKGISVFVVAHSRKGRVIRLLREAKVDADWVDAPSAEAVRERDQLRLADHPALSQDPLDGGLDAARALIERFGAERVAAAFLAELETRLPSPEELSPVPSGAPRGDGTGTERGPRRDRTDFDDSGWFEVNLGRKHRAEPKWLVPLICRVGGVKGADIGAIRIEERTTRFQIADEKREAFKAALTQPRERDQNAHIVEAGEPMPDTSSVGARPPRPHKPGKPKPNSRPYKPRPDHAADAELAGRKGSESDPRPARKPRDEGRAEKPASYKKPGYPKSDRKTSDRPKASKPGPAKHAPKRPGGAKPAGAKPSGSPKLKRIKRKRTD